MAWAYPRLPTDQENQANQIRIRVWEFQWLPAYQTNERCHRERSILGEGVELVVIAGSMVSKERDVPDYIQTDEKNKIAKLIRVPKFSEVPYPSIMEPNLVVEYYSR